jgi:hypothetical protein
LKDKLHKRNKKHLIDFSIKYKMDEIPTINVRTHDNHFHNQNYPTFEDYFKKLLEEDNLQLPLPLIQYHQFLQKVDNVFCSLVPWTYRERDRSIFLKDLRKRPSYIKKYPHNPNLLASEVSHPFIHHTLDSEDQTP